MSARTELADEIDAANADFNRKSVDSSHWQELEKSRKVLEDLLWVNKEAIVSYLRSPPSRWMFSAKTNDEQIKRIAAALASPDNSGEPGK